MRVAIAGAGNVGRSIARELIANDHVVLLIDRDPTAIKPDSVPGAEWLLADEPLTGLDPGHQLDAGELFRSLAHDQGKGVIVTLHDLSLAARIADRIIVMAAGQVLADGPPAQALSPQVMARAYGVRARVVEGQGGPLIEIVGRGG